jgi:hypothetical protein
MQAAHAVTSVLLVIALILSLLALWKSSAMAEEQLRKAMTRRRTSRQVANGTDHKSVRSLLDDNDSQRMLRLKPHPSEQSVDHQNLMRHSYLKALSTHHHYVALVPVHESSVQANYITYLRMPNVQEAEAQKSITELIPYSLPSGLTSSQAEMVQIGLWKSPLVSGPDDEHAHPIFQLTKKEDEPRSTLGTARAADSPSSLLITKFPYALTAIFFLGLAIVNFLDRVVRKKEVMVKFRDDDSDRSCYSTSVIYSNSPRDVGYGTIAFTELFDGSFDKFDL